MAEAASVFASVVPSLRGWGGKLASGLRKERTQNVDVDVTPKVDAKALNKAESEVRAMAARVEKARKGEADAAGRVRVAEAQLEDQRKKGNATAAQVVASEERVAKASRDAKTQRDGLLKSENALAAARAKVASIKSESEREMKIDVDADTSKAQRSIMALRAFASRDITTKVDVDTGPAIVRVAALGRALGTLALPGAIVAATPYLLSLGDSAVKAAGALWLMPAAIAAGGLAVGALKIGLGGMGDALKYAFDPAKAKQFEKAMALLPPPARETVLAIKALKPQLDGLQLDVSTALLRNMGTTIFDVSSTYLPMLGGALTSVATGFNTAAVGTAGWLQSTVGIATVKTLLDFSAIAVNNLSAAFAPLVRAFITIGAIGAPILAQLTAGAGSVAERFAAWVGSAQGIQTITGWIWGAIAVLQQLWTIGMNVGSILGSLFAGGAASGESFLGILVRITGAMASALATPEGAAVLSSVLTGIREVVSGLWDKIVILWPAISALGSAFLSLITYAAPVANLFLMALVPAITLIANIINFLSPVLGTMIGLWAGWQAVLLVTNGIMAASAFMVGVWNVAVGAARVAVLLWTGVQWLLNAALSANPIGLVVIAIAALVAGAIYAYTHFGWFKTAVDAVGAAFVWVWNTVLVPFGSWIMSVLGPVITWIGENWTLLSTIIGIMIGPIGWVILAFTTFRDQTLAVLSAVGTALAYIGLAIVVIFVTPFVLAWQAISAIASWAWGTVIQPIFNFISLGLTVLGAAFTWLWQSVIVPVWNGITAAITAAWTWIRDSIFVPIGAFISGQLAQMWNFLWHGVIEPVWNGIMAAINAAWSFIRDNIFNPIMAFINGPLAASWNWLWHNVIEPVWNGIQLAISQAWAFIQGVFDVGKAAVNAVGQAFQNVADWVGRAWATIKEAARGPIQFVVDIVYNNGIRPVWNGIAGLFGMAQLGPVTMARGGVLPGYAPGKDTVPAVLSRGEGVLVPEAVRGLGGPAFVGWANRTFSGGRSDGGQGTPGAKGFSRGGVAHFADGGIIAGVGDFLSGTADFLVKALTDPAAAVRDLFAGITGDNARIPGAGTSWSDAPKQIVPKTIDAVIAKVKKWIEELAAMGGGGNWMPVIMQALALTGQPAAYAGRVAAQIQIESGGNPRAINLWDSNAKKGTPSKGLIQTIDPTFQAYRMPGLPNDPYNPLSNIVAGIRYTIARYGSLTHWPVRGGYDAGGLATGQGILMKQTVAPERVLSPRQTAAFEALVPMLSGVRSGSGATGYGAADYERGGTGALIDTLEQHFHGDNDEGLAAGELVHALRVVKRGGRP